MFLDNDQVWRKSSYSSNGENCVEIAPTAVGVTIRHSKHPAAGTISFAHLAWPGFLDDACSDTTPGMNGTATISRVDGGALVQSTSSDVLLTFDEGEWSAFVAGARDSEFIFD